jgi:ABC-type transporter Mla subunit MlaD
MSSTNLEIRKIEENVSSLQRDMAQVGQLVDRLDVTIEKLTEVSTTVSQLLAVQANRLEVQEKAADKIQDLIEQRRMETDKAFKELYDRIDDVEVDLQKEIKENQVEVLKKIQELKESGTIQHNHLEQRLTKLEKWMWIIIGGGVVIGFLMDKVNLISLFHN